MPEWFDRDRAEAPSPPAEWLPQGGPARDVLDQVAGVHALEVLAAARALRPEAHHAPEGEPFASNEAERRALAAWADRLERDLATLAGSDRPGWGPAMLLGMARLAALRRSVDAGRLTVLDAYADAPVRIAGARLERHRDLLPAVLAEARSELDAARERFARASAPGERDWSAVEAAANRVIELERVVAGGDGLRIAPAPMTPSRSAAVAVAAPPLAPAALEGWLAAARRREREWVAEVERRFGYRLLTRNCVTEVFQVIDGALANAAPAAIGPGERTVEAASVRRLGGRVDGDGFRFVPFVAAEAVRRRWRVVDEREIPSLRRRALADASRRDGVLGALREASPLGSGLADLARQDSLLLFYTDDAPLLRPALGVANLATGVGAAAAGLALAPFDRGDTLVAGLRGVLFSLPELAFVGIRKGSFEWVPPDRRPGETELDPLPAAACASGDPREVELDEDASRGIAIARRG
jgi:hypothetical protein